MWNWNFTCLHVNQNRFHIVFHIISLSLVLQCMMWIFLFHIVFSQVSHSFSHHIIKPSLYNAWCEFPISHSFFTSSMMWKGPSHFTWFSHGDFTLCFTHAHVKKQVKFSRLSHDLHMLFTWFTPVVFVEEPFCCRELELDLKSKNNKAYLNIAKWLSMYASPMGKSTKAINQLKFCKMILKQNEKVQG